MGIGTIKKNIKDGTEYAKDRLAIDHYLPYYQSIKGILLIVSGIVLMCIEWLVYPTSWKVLYLTYTQGAFGVSEIDFPRVPSDVLTNSSVVTATSLSTLGQGVGYPIFMFSPVLVCAIVSMISGLVDLFMVMFNFCMRDGSDSNINAKQYVDPNYRFLGTVTDGGTHIVMVVILFMICGNTNVSAVFLLMGFELCIMLGYKMLIQSMKEYFDEKIGGYNRIPGNEFQNQIETRDVNMLRGRRDAFEFSSMISLGVVGMFKWIALFIQIGINYTDHVSANMFVVGLVIGMFVFDLVYYMFTFSLLKEFVESNNEVYKYKDTVFLWIDFSEKVFISWMVMLAFW